LRWLHPEPYQNPEDSTWGRDTLGPGRYASIDGSKKKESWHLNKNIRKIAKLEISHALEIRRCIIATMLVAMVLGSTVIWMTLKWMFASLSNTLTGRDCNLLSRG